MEKTSAQAVMMMYGDCVENDKEIDVNIKKQLPVLLMTVYVRGIEY